MARIVLDGLPLQVRSAGVAVYTRCVVQAMARLRPESEFVFFGPPRAETEAVAWPANVRWLRSLRYPLVMGVPPPAPRLIALERVVGADLFHATAYTAPRTRGVPIVVSVHDLALVRFPELGSAELRGVPARTRLAAAAARIILASSEATRRDLIELLGVPPDRIRVVHLGCDAAFRPLPADGARTHVRDRYGLAEPYLLHVGTLEPRKNLARLIRAYGRLCAARRDAPALLLVGERGWQYEGLFRLVEELKLGARVRFTARVPSADLPALYGAAAAFVYPSLYEGFGLPPLEAMACGTPVVCSNAAALPEVTGDAALLVDPYDEDALAAALEQVLDDSALRASLRARALDRARYFTWERCARATLTAYDDITG